MADPVAEYENKLKKCGEEMGAMKTELQTKDKSIEEFKKRIAQLEEENSVAQKIIANRATETEEVDILKNKSESTLTKAKSIIFENMKVIKNQELQIDALNQQIESMKDVVRITKDLLEIRNLEVKQLENKINCMEEKVKAEKEKHELMHKKLETMIRHNGELKREYEAQLIIFKSLKQNYHERDIAEEVVSNMKGNSSQNGESSIVNNGNQNGESNSLNNSDQNNGTNNSENKNT